MTNVKRNPLKLDLQYFAAGGNPEDPPATPPAEPPAEPPVEPEKTFTQVELDEIIAKRLARAKADAPTDYDEIKAKLTEFEKAEQARIDGEKTELEKLQEQLAAKEKAEQSLTEKIETLEKQTEKERINNEFIKQASGSDIAYVDAALKLADLSSAKIEEDGTVSGMDDVIKSLVEDNPFLKAKKQQNPIGNPSNGGKGGGEEKTAEQLLSEAEEKARTSGRPEDRAAFAQLKRELK